MILIYTGNGKGKTSACVGQAVRAIGQGKKVVFGQFFKLPEQAGEQRILQGVLKENFRAQGPGFYFEKTDDLDTHRKAASDLMNWAREKTPGTFMLILDEAIYALSAKILAEADLKELIAFCKEHGTHLVLSGRGAPEWLCEEADLVSDLAEVKHHMQSGHKAQAGIEF